MIRLCDVRRRRPLTASAADDRDLQRRVLDLALAAHPVPLGFDGAATALIEEPGDLAEALAFAQAVRDLVLAGLLASDGLRLSATPAALAFARLEAGR